MNPGELLEFGPLLILLCWAAVIDTRSRRIPNWLTFGLISAAIGRSLFFGPPGSFAHAMLGLLVGGAIPLGMMLLSAMGGGDVKLLAAIGAWMGPGPVVVIFLCQAILGLFYVLGQAVYEGTLLKLFRNSSLITLNFAMAGHTGLGNAIDSGKKISSIRRPLPFAVPVFIATLLVMWFGAVGGF